MKYVLGMLLIGLFCTSVEAARYNVGSIDGEYHRSTTYDIGGISYTSGSVGSTSYHARTYDINGRSHTYVTTGNCYEADRVSDYIASQDERREREYGLDSILSDCE